MPLISDKDGVPQGADPIVMEMACDPCPSSDRWFAHLAYLCSAEACAKGSGKGADAMSRPLREGIRVNRDQNARPRGGGVDEDIYDVGESRASNHALLQGIDLPAEPPAESCLRNAVQCTRIYGNIGGALHIAANTHGDGACALHAVWGRADPERHMDLFAREVRRAVLEEVPENALTICGLLQGQLSDKFQALMDSVWKELVLPAATAVVDEQSWPSREAAIAWVATASHVQEAIIHFAAQRRHEEAALKDFAAEFFKPEYEADVIRPLCILLGYLLPTDATVNLFEKPPLPQACSNMRERLERWSSCTRVLTSQSARSTRRSSTHPRASTSTVSPSLRTPSTIATPASRSGFWMHSTRSLAVSPRRGKYRMPSVCGEAM